MDQKGRKESCRKWTVSVIPDCFPKRAKELASKICNEIIPHPILQEKDTVQLVEAKLRSRMCDSQFL